MNAGNAGADSEAVEFFRENGYVIVRQLLSPERVAEILQVIEQALNPPLAPVEFEADVHYPGAPVSRQAPGGETPRRLLHAYSRDRIFRECGSSPGVVELLQQLIGSDALLLSQNHHNCVMTKYPGFSSQTSWHQDIRYWSFDRPELISTWLALGEETEDNGGLMVIPGSHVLELDRGRLDAALFLRTDLAENQKLIERAVSVNLCIPIAVRTMLPYPKHARPIFQTSLFRDSNQLFDQPG